MEAETDGRRLHTSTWAKSIDFGAFSITDAVSPPKLRRKRPRPDSNRRIPDLQSGPLVHLGTRPRERTNDIGVGAGVQVWRAERLSREYSKVYCRWGRIRTS